MALAANAFAAVGGLTQKAGTAGCISETGAGPCADGKGLNAVNSVVISPDGQNAYATAIGSNSVVIFDRDTSTGALTQKVGLAGCISETGSAGECVDGRQLNSAAGVAVSPDGKNVYVASVGSDAITVFDRDPTTGALTQKTGTAGCISETGNGGTCANGSAIDGARSVVVSPDGKSAYAASKDSSAVSIFDRDATTGALTQKAGTPGCISDTGTGGNCLNAAAPLDMTFALAASPDGKSVYVISILSDTLVGFDRDPTSGGLTQKAGSAGCVAETGSATCVDGKALDAPLGLAVSPDNASVYVTTTNSNAVAVFDRDSSTGVLAQKAASAGCISETGSGPCADGAALTDVENVLVSPDGASAYVTSSDNDSVAIFDRDPAGALTQKVGTAACVSDTGSGPCADGVALSDATGVAVSPDNGNVYVASLDSNGISVFDRNTPPQTTIDSGSAGLTNDNTPTFGFSSNEAGSSFECSVDAGPFVACTGPGTHTTFALIDGPHGIAVRAIDPTANTDPTPATQNFTVDTKAPDTKITKTPKKKLKTKKKAAKAKVSFKSESGATFECALDKAKFKPCTSPFTAKAKSKAGKGKKHTISVQAIDEAGNVEAKAATAAFKVIKKAKKK